MPSTMGETLTVSVFGQSHSEAIGCVISGLPSGIKIDMDAVKEFMGRRAPGQGAWTTPRKEADLPEVVSGLDAGPLLPASSGTRIPAPRTTRTSPRFRVRAIPIFVPGRSGALPTISEAAAISRAGSQPLSALPAPSRSRSFRSRAYPLQRTSRA